MLIHRPMRIAHAANEPAARAAVVARISRVAARQLTPYPCEKTEKEDEGEVALMRSIVGAGAIWLALFAAASAQD